MQVSILIANYNNSRYLNEALESIYKQSYSNWEIVIVDDKSTDNSRQLLKELEGNDRIGVFYNSQNMGCGYTKRKCVEIASGTICGFLDSDDTLAPEALAVMAEQHARFEEAGLIYSKYQVCDSELRPLYVPGWIGEFRDGETQLTATRISHFATFKKEVYDRTDGINPKLKRAVDQDLYFKLEEVAEAKFVDEILYNYRKHNQGISTFENRYKAKYWHLVAAFDACDRRGISKEGYFNEYLEKHDREISLRDTKEYKLGKLLLHPIRKVYRFFK